jgi:hypothetical protein
MRLITILLTILLLTSCVKTPPEIIVKYKTPEYIHPSPPRPLNLGIPYFYVVSPKNLDQFLTRISKENNSTFLALTPKDYELLAQNMQELRRYILQQNSNLKYYKTVLRAEAQNSEN